ncbi:MAG: deoxyribodipyrimidine photo-lyase [Candidatus Sericytochromatia bacterium]
MRNIFWFRNDLRLENNEALVSALEDSSEVIPIYIISDSFINSPEISAARVNFLFDALNNLNESLSKHNSKLIIRVGKPEKELINLARETNSKGIYFNKVYDKNEIASEKNIIGYFAKSGYRVKTFKDSVIFDEKDISINNSRGLLTFDKFKAKWLNKLSKENYALKKNNKKLFSKFINKNFEIYSLNKINAKNFGFSENKCKFEAIENEAKLQIKKLFQENNDNTSIDYSIILGLYLRFGLISIKKILSYIKNIKELKNNEKYILEYLIKNDYYSQLNFFEEDFEIFEDKNNDWDEYNTFISICNSKSGIPIIDAIFYQIESEFVIKDSMKEILINFFMYNLQMNIDWLKRYLVCKTVDGDSYIYKNGFDNFKLKSIKDFDFINFQKKDLSNISYIKKFIPILENVPDFFIYEPYKMPISLQNKLNCIIGKDYPYPIIKDNILEIDYIELYLKD